MAEAFKVKIITPDRIFFDGEADFLEFSTTAGDIGVYKNHVPTTTVLTPGAVKIHNNGEEKIAAVHAGFAEILKEQVTLLAEIAEWPGEIDLVRAEAAKDRAEERIANKVEGTDIKRAEYALRKAMIRIDVAGLR